MTSPGRKKVSIRAQQADFFQHNLKYFRWSRLFSALYFLVPVWVAIEKRYLTFSQITILEMLIAGSQLILELPTGALADLWGRKNTIALGYLISLLAHLVFAIASTFPHFLIMSLLFGLSTSLISGSEDALIYDTLKQADRENIFSKLTNQMQILFNWGIAGATLIGGLVYQFDFRLPAILNGLAHLIAGVMVFTMIEPAIDSEKFTFKNYIKQTKEGFKELFKNKAAKDFSLFYILVGGFSWPMVIALKNFTLTELGYSEMLMGIILPIMSLLVVYLLHLLISQQVFKNLKFTFFFLPMVLIVGYVLGSVYNFYLMPLAIMLVMFVSSARWNILGKLTNQLYNSRNRATAISTLNMVIGLIYVVVMGVLTVLGWSFDNALQILFAMLAVSSIMVLLPTANRLSQAYQEAHAILD